MADFTIGGKGFDGIVAKFSTTCTQNIKITSKPDWTEFSIDGNTIRMNAEPYDGAYGEERNGDVTISYTAYTDSDEAESVECSKTFSVKQLSKNFAPSTNGEDDPPEPEKCTYFVVNGEDVEFEDNSAVVMCDSAFLMYADRAQAKYVYDPADVTGWISRIEMLHWDDVEDRPRMCSNYEDNPCVAESLMRHAHLLSCIPPDNSCKPEICKVDEDHATVEDMPQIVQDAINCVPGSYCHELGTILYYIDENDSPDPRSCTVTWYIDNDACQSTTFIVTQPGTGGGGGGCTVSLKIEGIKSGDSADIDWGDGQTTGNVVDGTYTHIYASGFRHNFKVTATGYDEVKGTFNCASSAEMSKTVMLVKEGSGCESCDKVHLESVPSAITLDYTANSTTSYTYSTDNQCSIGLQLTNCEDWLEVTFTEENITFKTKSARTELTSRSGDVYILNKKDGRSCKKIVVTQNGEPAPHVLTFNFEYYDREVGPDVYGNYTRTTGYEVTDMKIDDERTSDPTVEVYYSLTDYSTTCEVVNRQNYTGGTSSSASFNYNEFGEHCSGSILHVNGLLVKYNGSTIYQAQGQDEYLNGEHIGRF